MTIIVPSTLTRYGIAQMRFGGLFGDDITGHAGDILHGIQEVIEHGQLMADKALYTPQSQALMWYINPENRFDYGLMIDVFACNALVIESQADAIIKRLANLAADCFEIACDGVRTDGANKSTTVQIGGVYE